LRRSAQLPHRRQTDGCRRKGPYPDFNPQGWRTASVDSSPSCPHGTPDTMPAMDEKSVIFFVGVVTGVGCIAKMSADVLTRRKHPGSIPAWALLPLLPVVLPCWLLLKYGKPEWIDARRPPIRRAFISYFRWWGIALSEPHTDAGASDSGAP
jgi:hypothetical protein